MILNGLVCANRVVKTIMPLIANAIVEAAATNLLNLKLQKLVGIA
jgi:hypothetical protein